MDRRRVRVGDEAATAAGFVHAGGADGDALFRFEDALGIVCGLATFHADGVSLGDVLGDGQELEASAPRVCRYSPDPVRRFITRTPLKPS